jgi:hypothetical protein
MNEIKTYIIEWNGECDGNCPWCARCGYFETHHADFRSNCPLKVHAKLAIPLHNLMQKGRIYVVEEKS